MSEHTPDKAVGAGRNPYYAGRFEAEEPADTEQRLRLVAERDSLRAVNAELIAELQRIADADPKKWDQEVRDQFMPWAKNRARAAIASARKQGEQG